MGRGGALGGADRVGFGAPVQHTRCGRWTFNELSHFSSSVYGKPRPACPGPKIRTLASHQAMSINHLLCGPLGRQTDNGACGAGRA